MSTATEIIKTTSDESLARIERAREKLEQRGIIKVAVKGPDGSPAQKLAQDLGFDPDQIELHKGYPDVLAAAAVDRVASLIPMFTADGEKILHDETGKTTNLDAWAETGRALIGSIHNPHEDGAMTKVLV